MINFEDSSNKENMRSFNKVATKTMGETFICKEHIPSHPMPSITKRNNMIGGKVQQ